mgnify:CR=1 FL=1
MSRRRKNKKKAALKGQVLFGLSVIIIAALSLIVYELKKTHIDRDSITMCRNDGKITRETAIVVDATDSFSQSQALMIQKEIRNTLENSLIDERFTLYILKEDIDSNSEKFIVCNPGDGSDKSELTSNKRRLLKNWEIKFYEKITSAIDEMIGKNTADRSPIMEMIKFASINTMYQSSAQEKKLIVISDMMHHTASFSHYKANLKYEDFEKTSYALKVRPQLSGVDLQILYLFREQNSLKQNRGHIRFWEEYALKSGGQVTHVKTVN